MYGCDTLSFILREEHKLTDFEKRLQETTFRSKAVENMRLQKTE
jgi:hypothetical protein